jgi:hypothetical protein
MIMMSASNPGLFGTVATGDMSADELAAVGERVFGGDPVGGLIAVLKISSETVGHLMAGTKPVPAPLAIALLRCCHGLPKLKRINAAQRQGDKAQEWEAKHEYALIMNADNALCDQNGDFQQYCAWSAQLTEFILLRLELLPETVQ